MGVATRMTAEPNLTWPTLIFLLFANSVAGIQCYGRGNADQGPPRGASVVRGIRWAGASTDVQGEPHAKNGDLPSPRWRLPTRTTTHVYAKWDRMDWQTGRRAEAGEGSGQVGSADEGLRRCSGGRGVMAGGREDPEARRGIAQMDWACTYPDQIGLSSARWLAGRRGEKDKTLMDDMNDVNTQPGQESENGGYSLWWLSRRRWQAGGSEDNGDYTVHGKVERMWATSRSGWEGTRGGRLVDAFARTRRHRRGRGGTCRRGQGT